MSVITDKDMGRKPTDADQWLTDPSPRGAGRFQARITRKGERIFYFRYTTSSGSRDTLVIGPYDQKGKEGHFTLAAARERAASWAKLYRDGARDLREHLVGVAADKAHSERASREKAEYERVEAEVARQRRLTVRQVFERWAATDLKPHVSGDGKRVGRKDAGRWVREQFERRLFPSLGDVAITDVRKSDLLSVLDAAKAEGKLRTANVLLADIKQMFRFAVEREVIEHSPIELVHKRKVGGADTKRERALTEEELVLLGEHLPLANLNKRTVLGVWLILATGCRVGELIGAVVSHCQIDRAHLRKAIDDKNEKDKSGAIHLGFVDISARTWHLPTTKNQRDHTIHLSDFACQLLVELVELQHVDASSQQAAPWLFPGTQGTGPVGVKSLGKQIADRQRSGDSFKNRTKAIGALRLPGGRWTAHDLRRTCATMMSRLGVSDDVINECQNHVKQGMSGVYIRDRRVIEQARAFDAVGKRLAEIRSGALG